MESLAVVIPVHNEERNLEVLLPELRRVLGLINLAWEIVIVDDGSTDQSARIAETSGATVLRSERHHGKSAALQAGFDYCKGVDAVVTMDGDNQDIPAEIPKLLEALAEYDVVVGWKVERQDSRWRLASSKLFALLVHTVAGARFKDINSGFKAYRRRVLDTIRLRGDQHRLIPLLALDAGFKVMEVPVVHRPRYDGKSRYGWTRAIRGPIDLLAAVYLIRFGGSPFRMFGILGGVLLGVGLVITVYLSALRLFFSEPLSDRPMLLLGVLLIVVGVQIVAMGFLGEMVAGSSTQTASQSYRDTKLERNVDARYRFRSN